MNKATWESLTKEAQDIWDGLADSEKIKILRYASSRGIGEKKGEKPTRKINIIEYHDDLLVQEVEESEESETKVEVNHTESTQESKEAHPADPRKMMSGSTNKGKSSKGSREVNAAKFSYSGTSSEDIDQAVEDYWEESSDEEDF